MQRRGIVEPPIDDLMERANSKYQLVIFAAKRARQINSYYSDLGDGNIYEHVGPLVPSTVDEKPLSIALREIHEGKLVMTPRQD
jgi:DNA-directed RNA polymerase subunit omega